MTIGGDTTGWLWRSLAGSTCDPVPYRHWLLDDVLRPEVAAALAMLPVAPAEIGDTEGRRETHNASRVFFDTVLQAAHPRCAEVARAFQDPATIRRLNTMCGVALDGASLRIEFCQDVEGFWLEPHTDIGVKRFTMLVYLSTGPGSEAWGTDIYDADRTRVATVPSRFNTGLIFVPAPDTWHGVERRPIAGVRRSLIVNYVSDEWRARHELAFPDRPVTAD
jgi:hypothetical protein